MIGPVRTVLAVAGGRAFLDDRVVRVGDAHAHTGDFKVVGGHDADRFPGPAGVAGEVNLRNDRGVVKVRDGDGEDRLAFGFRLGL